MYHAIPSRITLVSCKIMHIESYDLLCFGITQGEITRVSVFESRNPAIPARAILAFTVCAKPDTSSQVRQNEPDARSVIHFGIGRFGGVHDRASASEKDKSRDSEGILQNYQA